MAGLMTSKQKNRFIFIACFFVFGLGVVMMVTAAFYNDISYYVHPSDLQTKAFNNPAQLYRLGGRVKAGSLEHKTGSHNFVLYDDRAQVKVVTQAPLPPLFKDDQGIIVEGKYSKQDGIFIAVRVLAKHDETYKPKACPQS
ncbi:MAG: cytochrome c maturation protein CcmE [Alphaproteobacteria bacterium]|nr:cytochrome c maturation protein CcmE [Alphaproteobacteria bacterium]